MSEAAGIDATRAAQQDAAELVEPADLAAARDAVAGDGALLFRGGGTKLGWGCPPARTDRIVSAARLDRLVRHEPGDMTAVVEAGLPLAELQEAVRSARQWLAIDPPRDDATVGGIFATADAGPRRQRYGTLRDLVIGTTVVLSDGSVSRAGGTVIKNVAGYDLMKLWHSSLGTLGFVVRLVVRLHPLPVASRTVAVRADAAAATAFARALLSRALEPSALDWRGTRGDGELWVRFEGRPDAVEAQCSAVGERAREAGLDEVHRRDGDEERAAWAEHGVHLSGVPGETVVRAGTRPSDLAAAADALWDAAERSGVEARLHSHAGVGAHTARLSGGDAAAHRTVLSAWRSHLAQVDGHAVVRRRIDGLEAAADIWGPPPSAVSLLRAVKARLDPGGRCAPGRQAGGI